MLYCRLAHTLVKKNLVWALKRRKIPRALEVGNIINGFNWFLIKSQIMQLCIQSYLSEELDFIAVTARTTTGTDVWETLLVNHICSEVLTEKKLDWQSQGWGRRSWRYDVALFPSPSLPHFYLSCHFDSRSSLCLYFLVFSSLCFSYFLLVVLSPWQCFSCTICVIYICCSSLSFHPLIICVLFTFAVFLYLSIRLSLGFLFLSFLVIVFSVFPSTPAQSHPHTRTYNMPQTNTWTRCD